MPPTRVLLTSRGSSGHVLPLIALAHALRRAGHVALLCVQRARRDNVAAHGLPFALVDDPPASAWRPLLDGFADADIDTAHRMMVGEYFGRIDTTAMLPGIDRLVERWRPDAIVRESWEFGSAIAAERHGIPVFRHALALGRLEDETIGLVAPAVDAVAREAGLAPDPAGDRLRSPLITTIPDGIDAPARYRFRDARPEAIAGDDSPDGPPLVYLTFGSVAGAAHMPFFPALHREAIERLAPLPIRLVVTTGEGDPAALGPLPANVRAERWIPQDELLDAASVVVCHGGHGTTFGALAAGVPVVVVPLFSADQWANGEAVASAGAGVSLDEDRASRTVFGLPDLAGLAAATRFVLDDPGPRDAARTIAAQTAALPPIDAAASLIAAAR
ncbi:MAG: glycosyltransferase family 1 protein [Solirubrobacteraceae bacterium]|nr:glycosyltransferase family 1 protein [Solirubrobacteraceae bacterium]